MWQMQIAGAPAAGRERRLGMIIGMTGGIGAGKSRVLQILKDRYKAFVIEADQVAKDLEMPGQEGWSGLVKIFGDRILCPDGTLDKNLFSNLIFGDPDALKKVNALIHPLVWERIRQMSETSRADLVVVEAALFDENSRKVCDFLVCVDTDPQIRIERLMKNRGYSREKCLEIMAKQQDRESFVQLSDYVIHNNGTLEEVEREVAQMMEKISASASEQGSQDGEDGQEGVQ